jgi:hypothetical protein
MKTDEVIAHDVYSQEFRAWLAKELVKCKPGTVLYTRAGYALEFMVYDATEAQPIRCKGMHGDMYTTHSYYTVDGYFFAYKEKALNDIVSISGLTYPAGSNTPKEEEEEPVELVPLPDQQINPIAPEITRKERKHNIDLTQRAFNVFMRRFKATREVTERDQWELAKLTAIKVIANAKYNEDEGI